MRRGSHKGERGRFSASLAALAFVLAFSQAASAQDVPVIAGEVQPGYGRITFIYPEALIGADIQPTAVIENGVLIAHFPRAVQLDMDELMRALPAHLALARLDPDGQTLRLALAVPARVHLSRSYNVTAIDLVDPTAPDPVDVVSPEEARLRREAEEAAARAAAEAARETAPPPRLPLGVRVAESADYARIVFDWTEATAFDIERTPEGVEIRFERDAAPDLVRLRVDPPYGVVTAEARHDGERLQVAMELDPGMTARAWSDGERVILDVMAESADIDSVAALQALAVSLHVGEEAGETAVALVDGTDSEPPALPGIAPDGAEPDAVEEGAAETAVAAAPAPTDGAGEAESEAEAAEGAEATEGEEAGAADAAEPEIPIDATLNDDPLPPVEDIALPHTRAFDASEDVLAMTRDPYEGIDSGPPPAPENPVPADGVVRATIASSGADALVTFPWSAPVGAAAFRRGDSVWLVFDAPAMLDVGEVIRANVRHLSMISSFSGQNYSVARVGVTGSTQVSVVNDGATWTFSFGEAAAAPPRPASVERRADETTPPYLFAALPTITRVLEVFDDEAGDVLTVATALGPAQGLPARRTFLEVTALPSAHGLGFERAADGVTMQVVPGEGLTIEREQGLALSGGVAQAVVEAAADAVRVKPGFLDFVAWSVEPTAFPDAHDTLARQVATGDAPAEDRIALARLLVAEEMGPEALGVLRIALAEDATLLESGQFRALRGAANVLAGRLKEAETDFNSQPLAEDPAAAPWRGYIASRFRDWREARRQFDEGADEIDLLRADWRGRFLVAAAESALALNDLAGARRMIDEAYADGAPEEVHQEARLTEARFFARSGDTARAIDLAAGVAEEGSEPLQVAALYELTRIRQQLGEITPAEAIEELEALRFRWRGDEIELEIVRTLGAMYLEAGELRQGMQLMKTAASRYSDNPLARQVYSDMSDSFRRLYLDGESDALDPIEALALWYEFNDLTPIGADGDRMLRRLADRLIDFDLLEQAAELLAHQVDNRLRGVARAQVATDLAAVYLMDQRPEEALNALRRTRVAGSPSTLVAERRLIEARGLADLTRYEHAIELLDTDRSPEALRLKADIAWEAQSWTRAAAWLEAAAADLWRGDDALTTEVQSQVLRSAVAYRLAGDGESVGRLVSRFGPKMADGPHAASWRTVTGEIDVDGVILRDLAGRIAQTSTLDAFLDEFRNRRAAQAEAGALAVEEEMAEDDAAAL